MKILILGAGSFAGQAIFSDFLKKGYEIFGINRSSPKSQYMWEWVNSFAFEKRWIQINIYSELENFKEEVKKLKPTHIIDLLGQGMVAQSWQDPKLWYETNLSNKADLMEIIRNLDSLEKYIRISTPEVFGSSSEYLKETHKFNPSTPYAISHAAIDFHLRCLGNQYDFPYCIGRFANFYGPGQQLYRVIPKSILSFLNNKKFILDGGGKSRRSFIFSSDIIEATNKLLFDGKIKEEYNFSSNEEVSILELINKISDILEIKFESNVEIGAERPGKDMFYRLDCKKSIADLNWSNKISLDQGLEKVIRWISINNSKLKNEPMDYIHKR